MSDETALDAQQARPAPASTQADPPSPPGAGQAALHYNGAEATTVDGVSFAPDQVVIVPEDQARRLAGRHNVRMVEVADDQWGDYLAMRARARASG